MNHSQTRAALPSLACIVLALLLGWGCGDDKGSNPDGHATEDSTAGGGDVSTDIANDTTATPDTAISPPEDVAEEIWGDGLLPLPEFGYQINVGPFTVEPGEERTRCAYAKVPFDTPTDLIQLESQMLTGSHHMNLYLAFAPIDDASATPCVPDSMSSLIAFGAQLDHHVVDLPAGIALQLGAHQQLILEAHFVNITDEPIEARGTVNLTIGEPEDTDEYAGVMAFFPNQIYVPAFDSKVVSTRCLIPFDADIFVMTSHMHHFGQLFETAIIDTSTEPETREVIYQNDDWHKAEYVVKDHGEMIPVKEGQVIEFSCHYENDTPNTVWRGNKAETDEMCIFGAAYVPFHGILLCQNEATACPDPILNPEVDPASSECALFSDCLFRCGGFNGDCWNCCLPGMNIDCMGCVYTLLGCAIGEGCATGFDFDMECMAAKCSTELSACLL